MPVKSATLVTTARLTLTAALVGGAVFAIGPFRDIENMLPVSDKVLHAVGFYACASLAVLAFPRSRRIELLYALAMFGGGIEIAQYLAGRDASMGDWLADLAGLAALGLPPFLERVRAAARSQSPYIWAAMRAGERRKSRSLSDLVAAKPRVAQTS